MDTRKYFKKNYKYLKLNLNKITKKCKIKYKFNLI